MTLFLNLFPFCGLLLSIALLPVWTPRFWLKYHGFVVLGWSLAAFIPECFYCSSAWETTALNLVTPVISDFIPFFLLISALYVVTGGLTIHIGLSGTPVVNTLFLLFFSLMASCVGTTGAAMLGIRPFIEMNHRRTYRTHSILFFIFLVCNVGGCLSAVGDPPLFLGFLKGVPFFWPTKTLFPSFLITAGALLTLYFFLDFFLWTKEKKSLLRAPPPEKHFVMKGKAQIPLIGAILLSLAGTARLDLGIISLGGLDFYLENTLRNSILLILIGISFYLKPLSLRAKENWHLGPLKEIGILFIGIFITAEPVLQLLQKGTTGPLGSFLSFCLGDPLHPQPLPYFWLTGLLSSFLDNAPTYLIFFTMAGGDPYILTTSLQPILIAISSGAVFMGALTYIGNAPNLLVKAIVEEEYHIPMPSFFSYIFWSTLCLVPILLVLSLQF